MVKLAFPGFGSHRATVLVNVFCIPVTDCDWLLVFSMVRSSPELVFDQIVTTCVPHQNKGIIFKYFFWDYLRYITYLGMHMHTGRRPEFYDGQIATTVCTCFSCPSSHLNNIICHANHLADHFDHRCSASDIDRHIHAGGLFRIFVGHGLSQSLAASKARIDHAARQERACHGCVVVVAGKCTTRDAAAHLVLGCAKLRWTKRGRAKAEKSEKKRR